MILIKRQQQGINKKKTDTDGLPNAYNDIIERLFKM